MPGHTFSGDHGPVAVMQNGRQIAGAVKGMASGAGRAELDSIYKASLPSVTVHGEGKQDGTPTPDNPIEPVFLEGASVGSRGKNLFSLEDCRKYTSYYGMNINSYITAFNKDLYITLNPKSELEALPGFSFGVINMSPGQTTSADWAIVNGVIKKLSFRFWKGSPYPDGGAIYCFGCYPGNRKTMELILSFFDIQLENGAVSTPYEPFYDGGTAPLPILRALPDGSFRESFNAVTGDKDSMVFVELDGSEDEQWITYGVGRWHGFGAYEVLQRAETRPALVSNYLPPQEPGVYGGRAQFWAGVNDKTLYYCQYGVYPMFYEPTLPDKGLARWKQHLKEHPLRIWYVPSGKNIEHYDPAILRQHPGYTQLIQQGGFREAEIEAEYWKEMGE